MSSASERIGLVKAAAWSMLGAVSLKLSQYYLSISVARNTDVADFGAFGLLQTTIITIASIGSFGLNITSARYVSKYANARPDLVKTVIAFSNLITLLVVILLLVAAIGVTDAFSFILFHDLRQKVYVYLAVIWLSLYLFNLTQNGILYGFNESRKIGVRNVISSLILFICSLLLVRKVGFLGALISLATSQAASVVINIPSITMKERVNNGPRWDKKTIKELIGFSIPTFLGSILYLPVFWLGNLMLVTTEEGNLKMALFTAANQYRGLLIFIPSILNPLLLPLFAGSTKSSADKRKLLYSTLLLYFFLLAIANVIILFVAPQLLGVFGESYLQAKRTLVILSVSAIFSALNSIIGQYYSGMGLPWLGFLSNFLWGLVFLLLSKIYISNYGELGLGYAYLGSYVALYFFQQISVIIINRKER